MYLKRMNDDLHLSILSDHHKCTVAMTFDQYHIAQIHLTGIFDLKSEKIQIICYVKILSTFFLAFQFEC